MKCEMEGKLYCFNVSVMEYTCTYHIIHKLGWYCKYNKSCFRNIMGTKDEKLKVNVLTLLK
uniref:Uncharacterized protein n=1 Tax=Anguilla anguilla TaxID=7936 RepID=A0A0E9VR93_ANGAN